MLDTWTDEVTAHRETEIVEEAFQCADEDRSDAGWTDGLIASEVDEPDYVWKNPRIGERLDLERGRQVYTILCDDGQERELKATIAKLNKKLAKWDQSIDVVSEEEIIKEHWVRGLFVGAEVTDEERARGEHSKFSYDIHRTMGRREVRQVLLTIESPAVAGKKTKLIGSFEAAEDGESVYRHALNGATEADIEPFLPRWKDCDHCGFKRDRRSSFVCEDEEGNRVVIGRQCSRDFLGLDAAELLAREAIRKTLSNGSEDEDEATGGWGSRYIHVETLVKQAYLVAKRLGGYSRDTSDVFRDHVAAVGGAKDWGKSTHYRDIRREYEEWVKKAKPEPMDFVQFADYVFNTSGDFGQNLQIAFSCEWVKPKRRNIIIAGVGLFIGRLLKQKREAETDTRPPAKHLEAAEGARVDFIGTVERTFPLASDYGPKTLVSIRTDDGAVCVHYHTGEVKPEAGTRYAIRATIKRHETKPRFGPQTILSRAVYSPVTNEQPKLL